MNRLVSIAAIVVGVLVTLQGYSVNKLVEIEHRLTRLEVMATVQAQIAQASPPRVQLFESMPTAGSPAAPKWAPQPTSKGNSE